MKERYKKFFKENNKYIDTSKNKDSIYLRGKISQKEYEINIYLENKHLYVECEIIYNENKTRKKYIKFFNESTKTLKNYRHGTTFKFAKNIKKYGFDLGERNAVYFAPANSPLAEVYGSDIIFIVDIIYNNPITFLEIQKDIIPILKQQNKKINESSINKELIKMGYDIILNKNEVAVLNLKNITIKDIQEIN